MIRHAHHERDNVEKKLDSRLRGHDGKKISVALIPPKHPYKSAHR